MRFSLNEMQMYRIYGNCSNTKTIFKFYQAYTMLCYITEITIKQELSLKIGFYNHFSGRKEHGLN